jgi:hypothetical protein
VNIKQMAWDSARLRNFWWYPYEQWLSEGISAGVHLLFGRDEDKRRALRQGGLPLLRVGRKVLFDGRKRSKG